MPRRRQPTAQRQRQIALAALRLLAARGPVAVTAKNLGAEVGISDAAVFKHFANKEAILQAAINVFEELLTEPAVPSGTAPLERLRLFFLGRVRQVRAHPEILGLAFSNRLELAAGEHGAERIRHIMTRSVALVRRCLRQAQQTGQVKKSATPEVLGWMVLGVLRATATGRTGAQKPDAIWSQLAAILCVSPSGVLLPESPPPDGDQRSAD